MQSLFERVRGKLAKEVEIQSAKEEEEFKKMQEEGEAEGKTLNPEWDKTEKEMREETIPGLDAPSLAQMSLMMILQTKMGKTVRMRNGARRLLMQIMDLMNNDPKFGSAEERAATAKELGDQFQGVTYESARKSLLDNFELEDGKDVRPS